MPDTFLFLTTADTEILAAAKAVEGLPGSFPGVRCANTAKLEDVGSFLDGALPGTRAVMIRLLGGRRAWAEGFEELRRRCEELGVPLMAFGGEAEPDAELTALSTAPSGVVAEAFEYLRCGGISNTANLLRFVADTLLLEGYGFEPPSPLPELGVYHPEGSFLEELDVSVVQGICATSPREAWLESDAGLSPLDTAWQVAIPEFDGRIVSVPFSFKERLEAESPVGAPLSLYRADPERTRRLAGLATRFARLGRIPNREKRIAVLLSNY